MIKSVARVYNWVPAVIGKLYFDDVDFEGLIYWFKDALEYTEQLKEGAKN